MLERCYSSSSFFPTTCRQVGWLGFGSGLGLVCYFCYFSILVQCVLVHVEKCIESYDVILSYSSALLASRITNILIYPLKQTYTILILILILMQTISSGKSDRNEDLKTLLYQRCLMDRNWTTMPMWARTMVRVVTCPLRWNITRRTATALFLILRTYSCLIKIKLIELIEH